VVGQFAGRAVWLAAAGLALGAAGALAFSGILRAFLFGISRLNPLAYALPGAVLLAAAALAAFIPARRAARIDPMSALRDE
jgi:ABC-type antimicrobial peptide transport system permease subunit